MDVSARLVIGSGIYPWKTMKKKVREPGLFSLEKRKIQGDLITTFEHQKGAYKKDGKRLAIGEGEMALN